MELETEEDEIGVQSVVEMETEDEDLPFPGFQRIAVRYLPQTHPLRHTCLRMITNPYPFHTHNFLMTELRSQSRSGLVRLLFKLAAILLP